jgi:hypothetical protein
MFSLQKNQFFEILFKKSDYMKYFISGIFLLITHLSYSQFYFGYNKSELKKYILETNKDAKIIAEDKTSISYTLTERNTMGRIFFSEDSTISSQVLLPNDLLTLNKWVSGLNATYAIVSKNEWTCYFEDKTYKIKLAFKDGYYLIVAGEIK